MVGRGLKEVLCVKKLFVGLVVTEGGERSIKGLIESPSEFSSANGESSTKVPSV